MPAPHPISRPVPPALPPVLPSQPPPLRHALLLAALAMLAFAGNSLLCRLALRGASMDAASFTGLRLLSGAMVLALIVRLRSGRFSQRGDWPSALALCTYAASFSWAYLQLSTATGALLLFGSVQLCMVAFGLWRGERLQALQWLGLAAACGGLVEMLRPVLSAPPLSASLLMVLAGLAWGVYSLRGRGQGDPTATTAGNFWRACVLVLPLCALGWGASGGAGAVPPAGVWYALASGALASGLGYSIWYAALRGLQPTVAAAIQLTVPPLAALGALVFLGEPVSLHLALTSLVVLGGVALVIRGKGLGKGRGNGRGNGRAKGGS